MMHPMAFHFGVDAKILFEGWHIRTAGGQRVFRSSWPRDKDYYS